MSHPMRIAGLAVALASVGALVAGCAGGAGAASTAARPSASASGRAQLEQYVQCLNQHGVRIALPTARADRSPGARPSGMRPSGARPSGIRPSGGFGGFGGFGGVFGNGDSPPAGVDQATWAAAQQACASLRPTRGFNGSAFTAYRNCLSDHGVTASTGPERLNTADPKVAAAVQACEPLRPTGGPRPSAAPSSTG